MPLLLYFGNLLMLDLFEKVFFFKFKLLNSSLVLILHLRVHLDNRIGWLCYELVYLMRRLALVLKHSLVFNRTKELAWRNLGRRRYIQREVVNVLRISGSSRKHWIFYSTWRVHESHFRGLKLLLLLCSN